MSRKALKLKDVTYKIGDIIYGIYYSESPINYRIFLVVETEMHKSILKDTETDDYAYFAAHGFLKDETKLDIESTQAEFHYFPCKK